MFRWFCLQQIHRKSQQLLNLSVPWSLFSIMLKRAASGTKLNHLFILYLFIVTLFSHLYLGLQSCFFLKGVPIKMLGFVKCDKKCLLIAVYMLNGRIHAS